jgi:hypothetical protein
MTIAKIIALSVIVGFLLGILASKFHADTKKPDGYFFINFVNPEDELFKLQIDVPIEELPNTKRLIFRVKKMQ